MLKAFYRPLEALRYRSTTVCRVAHFGNPEGTLVLRKVHSAKFDGKGVQNHSLSDTLILHLKRFKYSFFDSKSDSSVQYPLELNLDYFTADQQRVKYELSSVIVHSDKRYHAATISPFPGSTMSAILRSKS